MRTLKFRAWDVRLEKMWPWEEVRKEHFNAVDDNNWVFQQFTGLFDKSGVEIYEGDILRCKASELRNDSYAGKQFYNQVEFFCGAGSCGFRFRNGSYHKALTRNKLLSFQAIVIGNIYENPELLERC